MGRKSSVERADTHTAVSDARRGRTPRQTGRGGRPSLAQALQLRERILEVATELFLAEGYGITSIEAVAEHAGISKRTFYHRFDNKAALFAAVVHRIIKQIRPPPEVPLLEGASLHAILRRLATLILRAALSPRAIALHRLLIAESKRFPTLARAVYDQGGTQEATKLIGELLERELNGVRLSAHRREFAAMQFLNLVVSLPRRRVMGLGVPMTPKELETWADNAVSLFLHGCRGLSRANSRSTARLGHGRSRTSTAR